MSFKTFINAVEIANQIMKLNVVEGNTVLDCTVGNGNDTLSLARLVGDTGKVYGFDIQTPAIDITKSKLKNENLIDRVRLINDGHEKIDEYITEELNFIIYNLGYMPGGNKEIKTTADTTIKSIRRALSLLKKNGLILITCYTGHEGGKEENHILKKYFETLNQKKYSILELNFINQINNPPILYGLEKSN